MASLLSSKDTGSTTVQMRIIRDPEGFKALRPQWEGLFRQASNPTAALHFDWLANWWSIYGHKYGDGPEPLRVVCFYRNEQLVAGLPLYQRRSLRLSDGGARLCFIGSGETQDEEICPDYLDLLCLADVAETCAAKCLDLFCGELGGTYDRLELNDLADYSALAKTARHKAMPCSLEIAPRGACPIADLSGGLEQYFSRVSANTRQQCRRLLRAAQGAGAALEVASSSIEAQEYYEQLVELHQARWTAVHQPGCFASTNFREFHRRLVMQWQPAGQVILSRLRCNEQILAVKYGFRFGSKYDFYQSGVRHEENSPIKSPGIVSFLFLSEYLIGQGVYALDFLRGSSNYKQRLATTAQPLLQIRRAVRTWRSALGTASSLSSRAVHKAARLVHLGKTNRGETKTNPEG